MIREQKEAHLTQSQIIYDRIDGITKLLNERIDKLETIARHSYYHILMAAKHGSDYIEERLDGEEYPPPLEKRPRRQYSRDRGRQEEPRARTPSPPRPRAPDAQPTRPSDNKASTSRSGVSERTECTFCGSRSCGSPVECALRIPYFERMVRVRKTHICPERRCFKRHASGCRQHAIKCEHCPDFHHKIFCDVYAKKQGMYY